MTPIRADAGIQNEPSPTSGHFWRRFSTGDPFSGLFLALFSLALFTAVFFKGGVIPAQWQFTALAVSLAACLALLLPDRRPATLFPILLITLLAIWMALQLVPLPPSVVALLSPLRFAAVQAARDATSQPAGAAYPVSLAPPATWEYLLDVLPALAAFLLARRLASSTDGSRWTLAAPVILIAFLESLLGLLQVFSAQSARAAADVIHATGTYVNYDHFSGLLEMAFPLALMAAIYCFRKGSAARAALMAVVAAVLLMGVLLSLSRMGVLSTLAAAALTTFAVFAPRRRWRWLLAAAVPLLILASLSSRQLILRFAELTATKQISQDERAHIWRDTLHVIAAYPITGCGLGAYERGLYRFKTVAPVNTVDYAHNDYLQILAELGIPGFLLFAAFLVWILRRALAAISLPRTAPSWELAVGILASLLALGLHSLADFNLYIPANALALAWLAGIVSSLWGRFPTCGGFATRLFARRTLPLLVPMASLLIVTLGFFLPLRFDQIYPRIDAAGSSAQSIASLVNLDPANPMVWSAWAESLSRSDDPATAASAFDRAISLGPAMPAVRMRAANFDAAHSRTAHLLSLAPAILSQTAAFDQILFSYLQRTAAPVPALLGSAIPADPRPARSWLAWLRDHGSDPDLADTFSWMQRRSLLDDESAGAAVWTLWTRGRYRTAHDLWSAYTGSNSLLANPAFASDPLPAPFDWNLSSVPDVSITRADGLQVRFHGAANIAFSGVRQFTVLPPGRYRFAAEVSSENLTTDQGPFFRISDPANSARLNVATPPILGAVSRTWITLFFTVPDASQAVEIHLERTPSERFDNRIQGLLRVYRISLTAESR